MIKIAYVTKVSLSVSAAQSIQIRKMGEAFYKELGEKFLLVSAGDDAGLSGGYHKRLPGDGSARIVNLAKFIMAYLKFHFKVKPEWVFTRDIIVVLINAVLSKKVILEIHHEYESRLSESLFRILKRYKKLRFIVISDALKKFLINTYDIDHRLVMVAHDACDGIYTAPNSSLFKDYLVPYYEKYCVHAGSFNKSRGADEFLALARSYPKIGFVQIGGRPGDIALWKADTLDCSNLRFIPQVSSEKLKVFLASADLLFFPMNKNNKNWWCTSPMKIFDYLESGTPILGSCIGSTAEILSDGMFIEYRPEDIDDAKLKFSGAIKNLSRWAEIADRQANFVRINLTWNARVKIIIGHLD